MQIFVEDLALLVGELLEARERVIERLLAAKIDAELGKARPERVATGELAQHQPVGAPAHVLRAHDLVGLAVLEHAILMDAGLVREGVGAHDRLVRLHGETGDPRDQLRRRHDVRRIDASDAGKDVLAGLDRHHDLFERSVPRALSQPVDRALDLARAVHDRGERVGHRHPQIVVAMHRPDGLVRVRDALAQRRDQHTELPGHRVTDGIRNVDRRGARADRRLDQTAEEIGFRAAGVLGRELDIVGILARPFHRLHRLLENLLGGHAELHLHVDRRARDKGMHAAGSGALERFAGAANVGLVGPGQGAHRAALDGVGDRPHGLEVTVRRRRKSGFDHVDLQSFELLGNAHFLLARHRRARTLLPVAESRIEDDQSVGHGSPARWTYWDDSAAGIDRAGRAQQGGGWVICARGAAAADRPGGRSRKDATKDGAGCSWTDYNEIPEGTQPALGRRPTIGWHNRSPQALISGLTAPPHKGDHRTIAARWWRVSRARSTPVPRRDCENSECGYPQQPNSSILRFIEERRARFAG